MKTESKIINGKKVNIVLLGARDGIKMSMKLGKVVVPTIAQMFSSLSGKEQKDGEESVTAVPFKELVEACFDRIDELDIDSMAALLFQGATVDDFPLNVDKYFQANYGEFIDFLAFALETNFGSFFEASIFKSLTSQ
ncbi:tape measure chaperone [Escherichia phage mistaenkt]|uniref:Tape measure chaperone n=1 Tax=Escherichia phage mistaenkt TaxID=2696420 RepID=A0A6B9WQ08_9CAUD|nr:tape measure chaperone [Escherichia phage mistaenkt]